MSVSENLKNFKLIHPCSNYCCSEICTNRKGNRSLSIRNQGFWGKQSSGCRKEKGGVTGGSRKKSVWHFLGHLQTNKIKKVVGCFDYIHSVDSLKLAKAISECASSKNLVQKVLIQVNNCGRGKQVRLFAGGNGRNIF